ncbi:MAG TPA: hypothetical protein VFQ90_03445 [Stellaceae bacterium]|nr:hypothetical protein [Stellaceae bacterium]
MAAVLVLPPVAFADGGAQQEKGCGIASGAFVAQGDGQVTINCFGITPEYGAQLAGVLTEVLQRRLDPDLVVAKLAEIEGLPPGDEPRSLSAEQGQTLVQSLAAGKPAAISISADPEGAEPGGYALAIATRLGMAGWRIEGDQIRRAVPPGLAEIRGLVLAVRDDKAPPDKATRLKQAMAAARIFVPIVSKPDLGPAAALLWIGKRPALGATPTQ